MKIILYTMGLTKGGTERTIANLANNFILNNEVIVVTNHRSEICYQFDSKIKIINIDESNKINERIFKKIYTKISKKRTQKLRKIIEQFKPDIVFAFLPEPSIRLLMLKKYFLDIKMYVCVRNNPKYEFKYRKIIRNYYYKFADKIIVQSEGIKKSLPIYLKKKIIVIPNYISDEFIVKKRTNINRNKIVCISRLEKQKNISFLIKSFVKLNKNNYKLYIYGEGKQKSKLLSIINKNNYKNNILLCGNVDNIKDKIKDAYINILPSNYEGMPNSLLEAMSLGIPSISTTSSPSISDIIDNNINGLIIKKKNKNELIKAILVLSNYKKNIQISKKAIEVSKKYNKVDILNKWNELL